jgi:hypothetical protein
VGLAVVSEIVGVHAGRIDVASAPGRGSTFTVRLPLAAEPPVAPAQPALSASASAHARVARVPLADPA